MKKLKMKNIKIIKVIFTSLLLLCLLFGCTIRQSKNTQSFKKENPILYYKDIDVVVTSVDKRHWYASTNWYKVEVSVKSKEYQLTYTDTFTGSGMFGCPPQWQYNEGDIVKAELYSWVINSTREVVRREINRIY